MHLKKTYKQCIFKNTTDVLAFSHIYRCRFEILLLSIKYTKYVWIKSKFTVNFTISGHCRSPVFNILGLTGEKNVFRYIFSDKYQNFYYSLIYQRQPQQSIIGRWFWCFWRLVSLIWWLTVWQTVCGRFANWLDLQMTTDPENSSTIVNHYQSFMWRYSASRICALLEALLFESDKHKHRWEKTSE